MPIDSCSISMTKFQDFVLSVVKRSADYRERPIAVHHTPFASDSGLAVGIRPGLVAHRRTIT